MLSPSGIGNVDDTTVAFHLEAPNGNFPYLVSSDNYNAVIVPKGTNFAGWQKTFVGTAGDGAGARSGERRQRQPVRAVVQVDQQDRALAREGHHQGQAVDGGGRQGGSGHV